MNPNRKIINTAGAVIISSASAVGGKEYEGPLGACFDFHDPDDRFGQKTFEKSESEMYRTLLVSDTPFFMKAALTSVTDISVDVVSCEEYNGETGYGLYIFDSFTPETMPRDGAVWIINPGASLPDSGYTVQGEVELPVASRLTVTKSTASSAKKLTADLVGNEISITKYVKCGLYRNFTTLFSCEGNPVVFAGTNTYGNREVVFAFNLHDSNLPVLYDYVVLVRNLVGYSFPEMIERTDFFCGDNVEINLPANCESVKIDTPLGDVIYLDTSNAVTGFVPNEVGTYTVTLNIANSQRKFNVYAAMTESERAPSVSESELSLQGEAEAGGIDGKFDGLTVLFIALAVIFIADWMVYCYEKYQLR